ncbi:DeoR/GlpR family DNA-binding transcription regulator [Skermanella pratensis]|uniref:DeoR/GlpR family DNA-binding transcription regulator n=1 Tax=Skermanella pratensis TaxID=2233999 RepID=UPI001FEA9B81|nr:DeoR/GlpR family DNA-binding transcription regulator [Skermanella pratensis]
MAKAQMIPAERQHFITSSLAGRGVISIAELTELLGVSHMTVRRDIQQLERDGHVMTVPGGVRLPERISVEPSHVVKSRLQHEQKAAIGRTAAALVPEGAVVYLDAGTTTLEIARRLPERSDITVVTNDFVVAGYLARHSACRLYHTGGEVERENQSCVGDTAAQAIRRYNFDIAFLSTSSWGMRGVSTPAENKIPVKQAIVQSAVKAVLVTDSSKYGKVGTFNAVPLEALGAVVTDDRLAPNVRDAIARMGITVHIADQLAESGAV